MFKFKLTANITHLPRLRDLYPRARRNLEARIDQNVKPLIEADVASLIAPYPGPAVYPFQFATDKSRRYYFWKFAGRLPYNRTGNLAASWIVRTTALNGGFVSRLIGFVRQQPTNGVILISVSNDAPASIYVYGPRQVPGHANTGWGASIDTNRATLLVNARGYVLDEWPAAVLDAVKEG